MNAAEVLKHVTQHVPGFDASGAPQLLGGGYLNVVWRVPGRPFSVVVKVTPPYVAASPDVPLSPNRMMFEAKALSLFGLGGALSRLTEGVVRTPRLIHADRQQHVLLMEDLGDGPNLAQISPDDALRRLAGALGDFIGRMHATSHGNAHLARLFDNRPIQETRNVVQYQQAAALLQRAGVPAAEALGQCAADLGQRLLQPGRCLVMGDLWPRSILVRGGRIYLIDWEFAHFGNPAQDVGHLAAHLWMLMHRSASTADRSGWAATYSVFLARYVHAASVSPGVADDTIAEDAAIHFGCEILARTIGPFQQGYLYDGLPPRSEPFCEALAEAVCHLADPRGSDLFTALVQLGPS